MNSFRIPAGKLLLSLFLVIVLHTSVKAQPHAPGDIAFTGYHANPNDKFSFVLLKNFTAGQTINFTDAGWITSLNRFDTDEGLIVWTVPAGGLAAGKELTIDFNASTVTLFGGGAAGTIVITGTFGLNNGGDQIYAFTGTQAAPTSVLAGLHMNSLQIPVFFDACTTTDAVWDGACSNGNNAYGALPTGGGLNTLTGGTNALWIGTADPNPFTEWNNAKFNCASVPAATLSTIAGLRAAVNNKANWVFNDDANPNTTTPLPAGCNWLAAICSITLSSAAGTNAQTVCISTPITNITYSTTSATGATFSGLPAGVTGAWASNVVTISGSPTASGTFNYTVTLTGGVCTSTTASGTITVTPLNTVTLTSGAGTNAQTVSVNSPIANITYATTGATGATFSGLPSGVTGSWSGNVVTITGSPTATGTFNYTVTTTGGCPPATASGTITVNPATCSIILSSAAGTDAQTKCINTPITNITYTTTSATGATFSGLPAGVTGAWAANVVTISGSPTVSGTFNYTVTLTGGVCVATTATGTITVTVNNTVTLASAPGTNAQTIFLTAPITNISYSTTGATGATFSGLPAGVTGNWAANVVTISGTPTASGVFNYTVTLTGGCGVITATGTITVNVSGPPTALVAGDIAFTGYHAGTALVDSFSFVLLKAVNAGTVINFTDNAWLNPGVFRTGEEVLTLTTIALPAGAEIVIGGPAGLTARWYNYNCSAGLISAGTVTGTALDLNTGGDQIIAYQGPLASPTSLISMIHMNTYSTINFDCGNTVAAGLDPNCVDGGTGTIGNGGFSKLPTGLTIGTNAIWIGDATVPFPASEFINAKFNGCGLNLTTPALARAAINNQANWLTNNNTPPGFFLPAGCNFLNLCPLLCGLTLTSAAGTNAQTVCINTAITNITYATTTATGATFSGLPAGVTGAWAANVVTISGSPTASGTFNYTVTLTGGSCSTTANGTITVTAANTATLTSGAGTNAQTVSVNAPITNITYATTGATGATFSGLPSGVTGSWAANVATISGSPTATGTFNYIVTLTGGCGVVTANGTITVNPAACSIILSSAAGTTSQTVCINTAITNITYTTTGATGATFSGLPAGVTGAWVANVVTISGTPTASGTFNYTVALTGGPCTVETTTGSITVSVNNTITLTSAGGTNAQTILLTAPITNITYSTTGATGATFSGLPAGVTGAWAANVVTISGTPTASGTFNYTVTLTGGCGVITATGAITVNPSGPPTALVAGDIAFTGYHAGTAAVDSFSFVLLKPINAGTLINFTDNGWLNPGNFRTGEGNITFTSIALPAGAEIVIGGPAGLTARWYNYNCAAGVISAGTVTGTPLDLNTGGDQIIAYQGTLASPTSLISMIHMNTYSTINFDCGNTIAAGLDPNCIDGGTGTIGNTLFSKLPTGLTIGTNAIWIGDASVAFPLGEYDNAKFNGCGLNLSTPALARAAINNQANWVFDNLTPPGFTLPAGCNFLNLCPVPCSITLSSAAGTDAQTKCINTIITNITYSTTTATGATFSGLPAGVTGAWAGDVVTISGTPTASGTFNYTVTLTGGACSTTANGTITVDPVKTITLTSAAGTNAQTVCISTAITNITYSTTVATGATFAGLPAGVTGAWAANVVTISGTPTASGTFNYTVTLTGGGVCVATATGTISVTADNTVTLSSAAGTDAQTVCINMPITNITYTTTGATGATFSGLPTGVTGAWAANVVTISGTPTTAVGSPFNYTVTLTGGCGTVTATGTITVNGTNTITLSSAPGTNTQSRCISTPITPITYNTTGATGATFSGLPPGVNGNWNANVVTINGTPNTTAGSPFNYTVTLTGGCGTVTATGTITVNGAPPAFAIGGAGTFCQGTGTTLTGPVDPNYTYQWGRSLFIAPFTNLGTAQTQPVTASGVYQLVVSNQFGCSTSDFAEVNVADYVFNGSLAAGDATQTGRINRFAVVSTCAVPKACPGIFTATGSRLYDSYTITNVRNTPVCATIGVNSGCATNIFSVAYLGSFNPASLCTNYLADPGSSPTTSIFYEATIPANGTIVVIVHEVNTGTGCGAYQLTVDVPRDPSAITVTPGTSSCSGLPITLTAPVANTYSWSPGGATTQSIVHTTGTTNYTVTLGYGNNGCTVTASQSVTIANPVVNPVANQGFCNGASASVTFSGGVGGTVYNWTNTNTAIGLGASGSGNLNFVATNATAAPISGTITVTPVNGVCTGTPITFTITVANQPGIISVTGATLCGPGVANLSATANGIINWWDALTGGIVVNTGTTYSPNVAATTTYYVDAAINSGLQTLLTMPAQSSTFPGQVRGYWFTAPTDFVITSLSVPTTASSAGQSIAVVKFNGNTPPPVFSATTNAFTTQFITRNNVTAGSIPCNIPVLAGEVIGLLGYRGTINSYAPGDYNTTIAGFPVQLQRLGMQFQLTTDNPHDIWREFGGGTSISRIEFEYSLSQNCVSAPRVPVTATVKPVPVATATPPAQTICSGSAITTIVLTSSESGTSYAWTRDNTVAVTGIAASGSGNISGTLTNTTNAPVTVTFTIIPDVSGCPGTPITATVVVNPTPTVNAVSNQVVCNGSSTSAINFSGAVSGTVYNWTNNTTSIGLASSGSGNIASFTATNGTNAPVVATITVTPSYTNAGATCTGTPKTFTITVNPTPTVNAVSNQVVCNGSSTTGINFSGALAGTVFNWTNNTPSIGLVANGSGNIASFVGTNATNAPVTATITVTPSYTNAAVTCAGTPMQFTISINPSPAITLNAPVVIQPTCAVPTGTITVSATGGGGSQLEYSIDNGTTWQFNPIFNSLAFSSLAPGSYFVRARIQGGSCTVSYSGNPVVLGLPTCPGKTIPGRVEAESYDAKNGPQYGIPTDDPQGGVQHVIGITNGSWMDYNVLVTQAGLYTVTFRVATTQNNPQFQVKLGSTVLGVVNITNTGGWSNWVNVSVSNIALTAGSKTIRIQSTSNETCNFNWTDWVVAGANTAPTANAGPNQSIVQPASQVTLAGSGIANNGGSVSSHVWSKFSGGTGNITDPNSYTTTVTGLSVGTYVFRLTVTQDDNQTATSDVTVVVNPSSGKFIPGRVEAESFDAKSGPQYAIPTSDAGGGQHVIGMNNGSWMDYNVNVTQTGAYTVNFRVATTQNNVQFQIKLGATVLATVNIPNTGGWDTWMSVPVTNVALTAGTQTLRIQQSSNESCNFNWMDWSLTGPTTAPTANAGPTQNILPITQVTMAGSGTANNPGGFILSHTWSKQSGGTANITDVNNYNTTITGLSVGTYVFRLTVNQNDGQTATSDVTVTVGSIPAPTLNAGPPQTITLPANQVTLAGNATAGAGGTITSHVWSKFSGGAATITDVNNYGTTVTGLAAGTYVFRLNVNQNDGQTATSDVMIIVNPVAGNGKTIPGKIEAEAWDTKSGPQYAVPTGDAGGGQQVIGMTNGSWLDYNVTVLQTGSYTVNFRVATTQNNVQLQVKSGATVLGTIIFRIQAAGIHGKPLH